MIPICDITEPLECLVKTKGAEYIGHVNSTISGRTCQKWSVQNVCVLIRNISVTCINVLVSGGEGDRGSK